MRSTEMKSKVQTNVPTTTIPSHSSMWKASAEGLNEMPVQ